MPADQLTGTNKADDQMVARLKLFRENNPEGGETVSSILAQLIGEDNVKTLAAETPEAESMPAFTEFLE